ncbi:dihydroxyacetone kinase [Mrakia frigida]|uniref:dihydroxyacetone kinase n=1 Tax=Mrakia frigida TaxID=29902 RepID=UPI003FCC114B
MTSKHIINDPKGLVLDSLRGLVYQNPTIALNEEFKVIHSKNIKKDQVQLISGGGSGHEPSFAGFVGAGLLGAGVCGNVFASPNVNQIQKALQIVENSKGTLIVINQYTGDVLHFGLAKEQYFAKNPSSNIRLLAVGDDVSVGRSQGKMVGRRGLAGTVLVFKLAGALAAQGGSIDEVYDLAKYASERVASIGAGLEHCHIPGTATEESRLKADQLELGMGIHNEPGLNIIPLTTSASLVSDMISLLTSTSDPDRSFVPFANDGTDEVVLMVNNLGGISELELSGILGAAVEQLQAKGIKVRRVLSGAFMTSLNMPGFSLSLLLLPKASEGPYTSEALLAHLDAPGDAPGWKWAAAAEPGVYTAKAEGHSDEFAHEYKGTPVAPTDGKVFIEAIQQALKDVIAAEPLITRYDTIAGDGDCGTCLENGAIGILKAIDGGLISNTDVIAAILSLAEQIEIHMDGTSGALYSIFFNGLASGLRAASESLSSTIATSAVWSEALTQAKATLYQYTRARTPSRTLVDPLESFVTAFASNTDDFAASVKAGVDAAADTANFEAKAGRAAYVGREQLALAAIPDPGAHGVSVILEGILKVVGK